MTHLQRLDRLARTLKPAALRILLHYTATDQRTFQRSEHQIATDVGCSHSSAYDGMKELVGKGLVNKRQGSTTKASVYELSFLDTIAFPSTGTPISGGLSTPISGGPVPQLPGFSTPISGEPPPENTGLAKLGPSRVRSDEVLLTFEALQDRIRRASPKHYFPDLIRAARARLHGYMKKMAVDELLAMGVPHPPDDFTVAQFLSLGDGCGEWPALNNLLDQLFHERQRVKKYGWFLVVAMQRLHGLDPHLAKRQRELRVVKKFHGGIVPEDPEIQQIDLDLQQLAQSKKMR